MLEGKYEKNSEEKANLEGENEEIIKKNLIFQNKIDEFSNIQNKLEDEINILKQNLEI